MKDFINRNMPVFIIGLITLGVFLTIIVIAAQTQKTGPTLKKIENKELITSSTFTKGNKDARVVLVEFSDFECPACKAVQPIVDTIVQKYEKYILFAYKHFPLPQHTGAKLAAVAAQAAGEQGKFFEYAGTLYINQPNFEKNQLVTYATNMGLDGGQFEAALTNSAIVRRVEADYAQAVRIGLNSTPSFILNGVLLNVKAVEDIENAIKSELEKNGVDIGLLPEPLPTTNESTPTQGADNRTAEEIAVDSKYGTIDFTYSEFGFDPVNVKAVVGQLVKFSNATKRNMILKQVIETYAQLVTPITIKPGETYEIRMAKAGLWTFKEADHRHYGSVLAE